MRHFSHAERQHFRGSSYFPVACSHSLFPGFLHISQGPALCYAAAMSPPEAAPAPSTIVVRPPEGLARGQFAAPPWAIGAGAGVLLIAVAAFFVARHRRAKRQKSYESLAPQSSRR